MTRLSIDLIFESALQIHLLEEKAVSITFSESDVKIKLPTTRKLAEFLNVPHYYVLPYFAMMEQEALVTRAERVGIMTTSTGTIRYLSLMKERYPGEGIAVFGRVIYTELISRLS
jgi:hypothetical protein